MIMPRATSAAEILESPIGITVVTGPSVAGIVVAGFKQDAEGSGPTSTKNLNNLLQKLF